MKASATVVATGILLSPVLGCSDESGPAPDLAVLEGTWANENATTRGITQVKIRVQGEVVLIEVWGACHPVDCYWGTEVADTKNWRDNRALRVIWDQGFAINTQTVTLLSDERLRVTTFTHFLDDSGRADIELTEFFRKQ